MSKIIVIARARTASSRLPNKVLYDLGGKPAFIQVLERATATIDPDEVFVACTKDARDDPIELLANCYGVKCFRGPGHAISRNQLLGYELGLADDDWMLDAFCDGVLAEQGWLGAAFKACDQYDCDHLRLVVPSGTLLEAFHPTACLVRPWGYYRRMLNETKNVIVLERSLYVTSEFRIGWKKCLIFNFPSRYLVPWPWVYMALDEQSQGIGIKEIYHRLYRGEPIDVFDVRKLLEEDHYLSRILSTDVPDTTNAMPNPSNWELENIRQEANYVEVLWTGGRNVEVIKTQVDQNTTGGESVQTID